MDVVSTIVLLGASTVFALVCVGYGISLGILCLVLSGVAMFLASIAGALGENALCADLWLASAVLLCLSLLEMWLREKLGKT